MPQFTSSSRLALHIKKLFSVAKNKFPLVFRSVASYFPRFSSSSRQNVVDSRGVAEGVHKQALSHSTRKLRPTPHVSFVSLSVSLEDLIKGQAKKKHLEQNLSRDDS